MSLTVCLALILLLGILTVAFLVIAVRPWEDGENSGLGKSVLALFGVGSLTLLAVTTLSYFGLGPGGSPRISDRKLARVQQIGMYASAPTGSDAAITFTGDPVRTGDVERDGFQIPALAEGQRVRIAAEGGKNAISGWHVETTPMDTPVRLDGRCVNAIPGGWLKDKETFDFVFRLAKSEPQRFMRVTLSPKGNRVEVGYADGNAGRGEPEPDDSRKAAPVAHSLVEGTRLSTLLDPGSLTSRWHGKGVPLALQAGEDIEPWSILSRILVVRERKGDANSHVGMLIDPGLVSRGVVILRNGSPLDLRAPGEAPPAVSASTLSFGLSGAHRFAVRLPVRLDSTGGIPKLDIEFESPISYALPPEPPKDAKEPPFLLTSGRDMVPLDGYVFPTGNDNHPFYAKATPGSDYGSLVVQDGVSEKAHADDEPIFLGDLTQGIVARLHVEKPAIAFVGRWTLLILGALGTLFVMSLFWRSRSLSRGDIAWVFAWVAVTALLVVRLLLAYRCSLLPPDDATLPEIGNFQKALRVSLPALFLLPAAMILVRLRYVALSKQASVGSLRKRLADLPYSRLCLVLPALACIIPLVARIIGTRDDLLGIRTSIWTHLLLIGGLALFALAVGYAKDLSVLEEKPTFRTFSLWHRGGFRAFVLLNVAAILMLVLAIGDNGSLIYGLSVWLAVLVGGLAYRSVQRRARNVRGSLGWPLAFGMAVLLIVAFGMNTRFFVQRFSTLNGTIAYRLASMQDMDPEMLLNPARTEYVEATQYRNNRDQQWEMLLYAAKGASDQAPGYGGAPLSKIALKYPTSMTDTTYSVYLLGEFGPWAGAWTVALYLVLMAACFAGASSAHREGSWGFVPLLAIGAFFAVNGIYMAAADVGSVPFTGQNLPLLSLYSQADVLQSMVCLVIASCLMRRQTRSAVLPPKLVTWLPTAFAGCAAVAWLGVLKAGVALPVSYTEDLDAPEVLKQVVHRVEGHQVVLTDDVRIDPKAVSDLSPIEKEAIREFNLRPDKTDPEAGLYYAEPNATGDYNLQVNRAYFHLTSPYHRGQGVPWRKSIFAQSANVTAPRLYMLSSPLSLSLNSGGYPATVMIDSSRPVHGAGAAILAARSPFGTVEFAEYRRRKVGNKVWVTLKPRMSGGMPKDRGWGVFVEGKSVPDAGRELQPNDLISIEDRTGKSPRRYNLIYLGTQAEPLAFVRWRNGSYRRALPGGPSLGMVANIGRVADDVKPKTDLTLTLDYDLHQRLQEAVRSWCLSQTDRPDLGWRLEDPELTKPVSMTLLDTFTGDILALPSFPQMDPTSDDFAGDMGRSGPIRRGKLLRNWNFENHVVGSTIKPLTFSTMAVQLLPKYRLEDMVVHAHDLVHDHLGGIPLGDETAEYPPTGDISMSQFLTQSRTWPACLIGSLGLVESIDDLKTTLVPDAGNADITLGGQPFRIDLLKSPNRPVSQDPRTGRWIPRTNLSDTLLFQGLSDQFGAQIPPNKTTEVEAVSNRMKTFMPSLQWTANHPMPTFATEVVPRRVLYECDSMRSVKQELLTSLIGGAQSLWNNVTMAESFARLCTGVKVTARFEKDPQVPVFAPMAKPISDPSWRERALMGPLEQVHETGTAKSLEVNFKGYRAVMKTGTLGEKIDSESLMFTIGKFENGSFVRGQTVTGYFFMRDTNTGGHMLKFSLADKLLPIVVDYLQHHPVTAGAKAKLEPK